MECNRSLQWIGWPLVGVMMACGTPQGDLSLGRVDDLSQTAGPCSAAETCTTCLTLSGCNWTGGLCDDVCLMDTYCYGPGNPAAPSCPADCSGAGDCATCLDLPGCNWTGGLCDDVCLMDTYCYGPGNPAAPTCP